jgi:hypothetical protein
MAGLNDGLMHRGDGMGLGLSSDGLGPVLEASVVPVYCNDG